MKRKVNHYTDEFKLKVVTEYVETDISQEELKRKYGFGGNNCISNWMIKFGMKTPNESQIKTSKNYVGRKRENAKRVRAGS